MQGSMKFSIGQKFMIGMLVATLSAVLAAGAVTVAIDLQEFRNTLVKRLQARAEVLAKLNVAAMEFDDPTHAAVTLANLREDPEIIAARLHRADGTPFAQYGAPGRKVPDSLPAADPGGVLITDDVAHVRVPVVRQGQVFGTLTMSTVYPFAERLRRNLEQVGIALLIGFLVAGLVSLWIRRVVTGPIEALTRAVYEVVNSRDFTRRVPKTSADEVGILVDSVNDMFARLGRHAQELETSNVSLQQEVKARAHAETALQELNLSLEERIRLRTDELAKANEQLNQSQKMQAIGQLTGGVAHDFNNVLQVIGGNLQLMRLAMNDGDDNVRRLSTALLATERGSRLAAQLLAFARRQPLQPVPTNLGKVLRTIDEIIRRAIGDNVEVETVVAGGLWNTLVDPNQLENVILNLAINARDAMKGTGKLTLELCNTMLDDNYAAMENEVVAGQYVMLAISDTGSGMSREVMERAFEPFFTTKPEGQGTGLGLSMAFGFVKQSGGHIKIYSELGFGTTIKLYFPRSHAAEIVSERASERQVVGGSETILVVEDDLAVQATAVDTLQKLGYRVLKANEARSALTILESGVQVDFLFTDVVMPGPIRSPELAARARKINPAIVVLFTSGYTQNAIVHGGRLDPGVELISKPYRREDLARKIRSLLDNAQAVQADDGGRAGLEAPEHAFDVLVVDDVLDNATILCDLLNHIGVSAVTADSGARALEIAKESSFKVLITDMNMPGMSGAALAAKLRAERPSLKIVFSSGYGATDNGGIADARFLSKPYTIDELGDLLKAVELDVVAQG